MIDWSRIERRILAHQLQPKPYARFLEYGTVTGRMTTNVPPFKEIPHMDRNPLNIMDPNIRRLSEFVFKHYHSNPGKHQHSRVSDTFAVNIAAADPEVTMELATILAHIAGAPTGHEVTAFAMAPKRKELEDAELSDWLQSMMSGNHPDVTVKEGDPGDPVGSIQELLGRMGIVAINLGAIMADDDNVFDRDLVDGDDDLIEEVLWARVWQELGGDEADVSLDPEYEPHDLDYPVPALHGPNVTPMLVNGAIIEVLDKANRCDLIDQAFGCMANRMDDHGWVYCHDNLPN